MTGIATIFAAAALAASPNPIVGENALPGAEPSTWLQPAYPPTSVQGYTSEVSVLPGEDVHFHVSTNDGDRYRIEIYRLGWSGGAGARVHGAGRVRLGVQPRALPRARRLRPLVPDGRRYRRAPGEPVGTPARRRRRPRRVLDEAHA